jgi:hypothetical protein
MAIILICFRDLQSTGIAGEIPASLVNMTFLQKLNLQENLLEGQVPDMPASLTSCNVSSSDNTGLCETFGEDNLCTAGLELAACVTDCVIMNAWLPESFNGTGTVCCSQTGITCVNDRITEMYAL